MGKLKTVIIRLEIDVPAAFAERVQAQLDLEGYEVLVRTQHRWGSLPCRRFSKVDAIATSDPPKAESYTVWDRGEAVGHLSNYEAALRLKALLDKGKPWQEAPCYITKEKVRNGR